MDLFDILLVKKLIGKINSDGATDEELQEIIKQLEEKVSKDELKFYIKSVNSVAPDENGNVNINELPTGSSAYQQLVTDGEGKAKWEDKAFGVEISNRIEAKGSAEYSETYVRYGYFFGREDYIELKSGMVCDIYLEINGEAVLDQKYTVNENNKIVAESGVNFTVYTIENVTSYGGRYNLYFSDGTYWETKNVVLRFSVHTGIESTLNERFLPTTVPVIQTATVGHTIVVKAVDDEGKPTEWETVDIVTEDRVKELINLALENYYNKLL